MEPHSQSNSFILWFGFNLSNNSSEFREGNFCAHTPTIFLPHLCLCRPNESDTFQQTYDLINGLIPIWTPYRATNSYYFLPTEVIHTVFRQHWMDAPNCHLRCVCRILVVNEHLHGADGWNQYWTGYSLCGRYCRIGFAAGQATVSGWNRIEWSLNGVPILVLQMTHPGNNFRDLCFILDTLCVQIILFIENTSIPINFV